MTWAQSIYLVCRLSFVFNNQNYCFTRWPFGCRCSGAVFCRAIAYALRNVKRPKNLRDYVDDILIHAKTFVEFFATLDEVLAALNEHGIVVSGKKANFLKQPVRWLGRLISSDGITPDLSNIEGIEKMRARSNFKQLQAIIGSVNWIRHHASVKIGEDVGLNTFST